MNKTVVISVILFHVIGMAEFRKFAEELTSIICVEFREASVRSKFSSEIRTH